MSSLRSYPCQIAESSEINSNAGLRTRARIACAGSGGLASSTDTAA